MKKIVYRLLICGILICSFTNMVLGFGHEEHDKQMEYVIFGDEEYSKNNPGERADVVTSLHYATYFCVDQFNYNKQAVEDDRKLAFLRNDRKVPGLPQNVENELNYTAFGEKHRIYTHRGWDHSYSPTELEKSHWETRKKLLIATVKKEFDPGIVNNVLSFFGNNDAEVLTDNYDAKCEEFAALLYYIHLLGDYIYDNEELKKSGSKEDQPYMVKDLIIALGGTRNNETIIHDLKECLQSLFGKKKSKALIAELDRIETKIDYVLYEESKVGGLNTVGRYLEYSSYGQEVLDTLHDYIPELLREEAFFSRVFSS